MKIPKLLFSTITIFLAYVGCAANAQERDPGSIQDRIRPAQGGYDAGIAMSNQARQLSASGQNKAAEQQFKAALSFWDQHPPKEPHARPSCLNNLGLLYANQGKYDQAIAVYRQAIALEEKSLSANDPLVALTSDNLAQSYRLQGKLQEAEPLYLKALAIEEKSMAPNDQDHAITMFNLSLLYFQSEKYDKCEPLMTQSLAMLKKSLGENNPDYLNVYKYYLALLRKTNRAQQADTLEQQIRQSQSR